MTVFPPVSLPPFHLEDDDFLVSALIEHTCFDRGAVDGRSADSGPAFIGNEKDVVERHLAAWLTIDLLDPDFVAFFIFVLGYNLF